MVQSWDSGPLMVRYAPLRTNRTSPGGLRETADTSARWLPVPWVPGRRYINNDMSFHESTHASAEPDRRCRPCLGNAGSDGSTTRDNGAVRTDDATTGTGTEPSAPAATPAAATPPRDPRVDQAARAIWPPLRAMRRERDFAVRFWDGRGIRPALGTDSRGRASTSTSSCWLCRARMAAPMHPPPAAADS